MQTTSTIDQCSPKTGTMPSGATGPQDVTVQVDETVRRRTLAGLLPLWPNEIGDCSLSGQQRICALLLSALRRERARGVSGHWTYNVGRHAALARALRPELKRLAQQRKTPAVTAGVAILQQAQ